MIITMLFLVALFGPQQIVSAGQPNDTVDEYFKKDVKSEKKLEQQENDEEPTSVDKLEREKNESTPIAEMDENIGLQFGDFVKMIFATIFVVALLYLILKFVNQRSRSFRSSQLIENLGGTSLGTNRSVQMIKVGERILVVGVGESIDLLVEINDQDECQQIVEEYNRKLEHLGQPNDIVTKLVEKLKSVKSTYQQTDEFPIMLKNELKGISDGRKKLYDEIEQKGTQNR